VRVSARLAGALLLAASAACTPPVLKLPAGPPAPLADTHTILQDALGHCAGLHSITAELGLSGRVGATKLRGRLQAGFVVPDRLRLEAVAPFGAPFFIVAGSAERTTLWLPRDARVLRDAPAADIVDALAGFSATPDDLAAWLAGCPSLVFNGGRSESFGADWARIVDGDRTSWFHKTDRWRLVQTERDGLSVELAGHAGTQPGRLRIRRPAGNEHGALDVGLSINQVETNVPLGADAFNVTVPAEATSIDLDELRRSGPLRDSGRGRTNP
jgi:hypothetical protein